MTSTDHHHAHDEHCFPAKLQVVIGRSSKGFNMTIIMI